MNQRQIKFRVWDKYNKEWATDFTIGLDGFLWSKRYGYCLDDFVVMQFTGLHDKNGKEIYEGDVIKHDNVSEPLEVYWCEATGQWKLGYGERRHYYGCLYLYPNNLLEVVGDVYEGVRISGEDDEQEIGRL